MKSIYIAVFVALLSLLGAVYADPEHQTYVFKDSAHWFQWLDDDTVFVISGEKLFKSINHGQSWFNPTLPGQSNTVKPSVLTLSAHHDKHLFLTSNTRMNWVSEDKGQTWKQSETAEALHEVHFNPHDPSHLIAMGHTWPTYGIGTVYTSADFGKTWSHAIEDVIIGSISWGDAGRHQVPTTRFYLSIWEGVHTNDFVLAYSDDFGKTSKTVHERVIAALWRSSHLFVLQYTPDYMEYYLKVSKDIGKGVKQFYRAEFPDGEELATNAALYYLLDDHTGAVHFGILSSLVNDHMELWSSGSDGIQYSLSLPYMVFDHWYRQPEFVYLHGLSGVLIANQFTGWDDNEAHSLISYDNGKNWDWITAPGKQNNHDEGLHLHSWSFEHFGPLYSHWSAKGLVIGNGNVGEYLDPVSKGTYLSSDGGVTWKELSKKRTIYEFSDFGSILVWAETEGETRYIYYSLDYGKTTQSLYLNVAIQVDNIVTSSKETGVGFIVQGTDLKTIISLNFRRVLGDKSCVLRNDYNIWIPENPRTQVWNGHKCLAGRQISVRRKKTYCINPHDFAKNQIADTKYCPCQEEDYECDFGYFRMGDQCHRDTAISLYDPPHWCLPGDKYNVTDGYRKEAGNECTQDLHRPTEKNCPATPMETETTATRRTHTNPSTSTSTSSTRTSQQTHTSRTSQQPPKTSQPPPQTSQQPSKTSQSPRTSPTDFPATSSKDNSKGGDNNGGSSHTGVVVAVVIIVILAVIAGLGFLLYKNESLRERIPFIQNLINLKNGYSRTMNGGGGLMDDEDLGTRL